MRNLFPGLLGSASNTRAGAEVIWEAQDLFLLIRHLFRERVSRQHIWTSQKWGIRILSILSTDRQTKTQYNKSYKFTHILHYDDDEVDKPDGDNTQARPDAFHSSQPGGASLPSRFLSKVSSSTTSTTLTFHFPVRRTIMPSRWKLSRSSGF